MKSFRSFITEKRRGGEELNPHISTYQALEKYKDDPDIFITFTKLLKVGINPNSEYYTPNGVYTYPLKQAWGMYANKFSGDIEVPFAGKSPFVTIIRRKGKYIDDIGVTYGSNDFDNDLKKLYYFLISKFSEFPIKVSKYGYGKTNFTVDKKTVIYELLKPMVDLAMSRSQNKSVGGQMWSITKYMSAVLANTKMIEVSISDNESYGDSIEIYDNSDRILTRFSSDVDFKLDRKFNINDNTRHFTQDTSRIETMGSSVKETTIWSKIWIGLGYQSVADRSHKGIIHIAEPTQAVFFSRDGYDVIGTFDNKSRKGGTETINGITGYLISPEFIAYNEFNKEMTWKDAERACRNLGAFWRLPTVKEFILMQSTPNKLKPGLKKEPYWMSVDGMYIDSDGEVLDQKDEKEKHMFFAVRTVSKYY